ncbi:low molecular weight phosphatase family protein [Sphaerisporangium rubeum]|uniref:Protein-tyrosine phosphatase n=1 Tax=Sphaerisporangium rubeum TaxID=321317 RepID=A0A7X0M7E6_9ACTN|nr:low molecular weight phosphatase family protein [Sphaerisporangium rubeum]MBB6472954.1 protein-tyrosine phosphatase [Sphaerisporangium rubeum]
MTHFPETPMREQTGRPVGQTYARATPASRTGVFRVLFVCSANLCRSPAAERIAGAALAGHPAIVAESAGTHAVPGGRLPAKAVRALEKAGVAGAGERVPRLLTTELIEEADLVLAAALTHRAWIVSACPAAAHRVFTVAEFGALAAAVPPALVTAYDDPVRRAHALLAEARDLRGVIPVDRPDIGDPYGGPPRAYRAAVRAVRQALEVPLSMVTGPVTPRPAGPAPR